MTTNPITAGAFRRRSAIVLSACCTVAFAASAFASPAAATPRTPVTPDCPAGKFCYWPDGNYLGKPQLLNLENAGTSVCIPLPHQAEARSFVNNRAKEITLYEGGHCSTEGDFRTYPADTYVPEAPYLVRAVEIWE